MVIQQKLSVYALGPVQVFRDEQLLTDWAYLDSVELLFYLLQHTRKPRHTAGHETLRTDDLHGKTREQIGLELWPDASPQQLSSKLKSRLYDLRRVLGDGEWIVFDNGQYKFNATRPYWFDVEQFTGQIAEGESLRSKAPSRPSPAIKPRCSFIAAIFWPTCASGARARSSASTRAARCRGANGTSPRRRRLLSAYRDALHTLAKLWVAAGGFEQAAEAYRLAAAKDDYDDEAHTGLMQCLALQGKRSQALDQYRRLLKRRGDTPPVPEMVALAERLKREELAPSQRRRDRPWGRRRNQPRRRPGRRRWARRSAPLSKFRLTCPVLWGGSRSWTSCARR